MLIEKDADINHKGSHGETPLLIFAGPGKQNKHTFNSYQKYLYIITSITN